MIEEQAPFMIEYLVKKYMEQAPVTDKLAEDSMRGQMQGFVEFCAKHLSENRPVLWSQGNANYSITLQDQTQLSIAPPIEFGMKPHPTQPVTGGGTRTPDYHHKTKAM